MNNIFFCTDLKKASKEISGINLDFLLDGMEVKIPWLVFWHSQRKNHKNNLHHHSFHELHLCVQGNCIYLAGNKQYKLEPGCVIVIRANEEHSLIHVTEDFEKISFGFYVGGKGIDQDDTLKDAFEKVGVHVSRDTHKVQQLFMEIIEEFEKKNFGYLTVVKTLLMRSIVECARICGTKEQASEGEKYSLDQRIATVNNYISKHADRQVQCQEVADCVYMSTRQLNRIMDQELGMSLHEYIEQVKCDMAKDMLLNTDMRIVEIAEKLGYANEFSFSKFFKRAEGMSPAGFRQSKVSD